MGLGASRNSAFGRTLRGVVTGTTWSPLPAGAESAATWTPQPLTASPPSTPSPPPLRETPGYRHSPPSATVIDRQNWIVSSLHGLQMFAANGQFPNVIAAA